MGILGTFIDVIHTYIFITIGKRINFDFRYIHFVEFFDILLKFMYAASFLK